MAKVGVALSKGQTGAPPPSTATPMEEDIATSAIASKDAAGQVSGAGTTVKPSDSGEEEHNWVEPQAFKSLVGRGHADFSSGHQQVGLQYQLAASTVVSQLLLLERQHLASQTRQHLCASLNRYQTE